MGEGQGYLISDEDKMKLIEQLEEKIIEQNEYIVQLEMAVERLHGQLTIAKTRN